MKSPEHKAKTHSSANHNQGSFFSNHREAVFFSGKSVHREPFFQPSKVRLQAKLTVGAVGDKYEQEADRVAANVVAQINDSSAQATGEKTTVQRMGMEEEEDLQMKPVAEKIQRMGMEEEEDLQMSPIAGSIQRIGIEEDEDLQMKPTLQRVGNQGGAVSTDLEAEIQSARGGGQALAPDLQAQMGQAMGADFSGVRVHTDAQSDRLNQSIQAKAFTTGQDVFFRQGAYEPGSRGGQELIAHELTHVVQQGGVTIQRHLKNPADAPLEASLIRQYHTAENKGDDCSIVSRSVAKHQKAIAYYQEAKRLRRRVNKMHDNTDRGHAQAISTLEQKINARRQKIRALTPSTRNTGVPATSSSNNEMRRPDWSVSIGTASQASWITGIPSWYAQET